MVREVGNTVIGQLCSTTQRLAEREVCISLPADVDVHNILKRAKIQRKEL